MRRQLFIFILLTLIFSCASSRVVRNVSDNKFYSSYPKIAVKLDPDLKYLGKIEDSLMIERTYNELLTARVEGQKGPIFPEELEKAKSYIQGFIKWTK